MHSKLFKHLFFTLLLTGVLAGVWHYKLPPFYAISLGFDDYNFQFHDKTPNDKILFIAIDEVSVNKLGRWPWDRKVVAQGVQKLAEADVVLFDMVFSEATNEESDFALGEAIGGVTSVCGFFLRQEATQLFTRDDLIDSEMRAMKSDQIDFGSADYIETNIDAVYENCTRHASFSTLYESDSIFRFYPMGFEFQGSLYPSIGLRALSISLQQQKALEPKRAIEYDIKLGDSTHIELNSRWIEVDKRGFTRLNFYPRENYKSISFYDLYAGNVDPEVIKNKIIILGITEAGVEDVRATPIGAIAGPLLHYTFVSNYLDNDLITHQPSVMYGISIGFVFFALFATLFLKRVLTRGIVYILVVAVFVIVAKWLYIRYNIWWETFYPLLFFIASAVLNEVIAFTSQEKEAKFIQSAFSSYLSPILLDKLKAHPELLQLGGENKEMTIFFSDIRSFTAISERMQPEELVKLLNRYFTPMAHIVRKNEGMLDKYIGDAIMAFYNAPLDVTEHAKKACRSALEMIEHLKKLNTEFVKEGLPIIDIGIGLNTAKVIVGNMGSDDRFNYTVIGDGVNLASRVEGLNKNYHTKILITHYTKEQLDESFLCRRLEPVQVKGKNEAVTLYELMANTPENQGRVVAFHEILTRYEAQEFDAVIERFEAHALTYGDEVSTLFAQKARENSQKVKNHETVGAVKFTTK